MLDIILIIFFLSLIIVIHELGHFLSAKKFGVYVEEFGIGMPPKIWGKKIGETIYSINALPFGAFVKIFGEKDSLDELDNPMQNARIDANDANLAANDKIIEKELSYKLTGIFFEIHRELGRFSREKHYGNLLEKKLQLHGINYIREHCIKLNDSDVLFADFLIEERIVIELKNKAFILKNDYYQTKNYLEITGNKLGMIVNFRDRFLKPKRILNSKIDVICSDSQNSREFVDSHRENFENINKKRSFSDIVIWQRMVIITAGVFLNFVLGWLIMSVIFMIGAPEELIISGIAKNSPAEQAGILAGDKFIKATAGNNTIDSSKKSQEFIDFINNNKGKSISLDIERNKELKNISVVPRENPPIGEGALGVSLLESGFAKKGFFSAFYEGLKKSIYVSTEVFKTLFNILIKAVTGKNALEGIAGPVGIFGVVSEANKIGLLYLFNLLAIISLNLAAFNLFPFPALDGGRLLFLIIEKIKGSPLSKKVEIYANAGGMLILLALMGIITIKDILNLL